MKNTTKGFIVPVIIIIAALALGGGAYAVKKSKQAHMKTDTSVEVRGNATSTNAQATSTQAKGSLKALLGMNQDVMCTFNGANTQGQAAGTVYISGPMMRGDFTSHASSTGTVESHMIRDKGDVYVWTGTQGAKLPYGQIEAAANSSKNKMQVDLNQQVDYKCSPWTPETSKFSLPGTVKFIDVSAMLKAAI